MKVVQLNSSHVEILKPLFTVSKFMSVNTENNYFIDTKLEFSKRYYENFIETYLSDLKQYHAFGIIDHGSITGVLGFYESIDDASWYWNTVRTLGNNKREIKMLLDSVMAHNENNGRFKFYSMFPKKYKDVYRRLAFSTNAKERYDYFDEYYVEARHQCKFTLPWQILYARTLLPVDTIVRCTFLKQEYRTALYNAGRL